MLNAYIGWGGYQGCMFGLHVSSDKGSESKATWGQAFEEGKNEKWKAERDRIYADAMKQLELVMKDAGIESIKIFDSDIESESKKRVAEQIINIIKKELK